MRKVDVVYLYEHAARELDVACAVTARLRAFGMSVEIVHWPTGFPHAVTRIRPRLVILPFCYTEDSYEALLAYWRESIFFNLTWEQLFYLGNQKAKTPRGEFALKHVIHHAWSEVYKSFLMNNGLEKKNIFLNGQPAYTLYDEPYQAYFPSRKELAQRYGLEPARRWIFFPENYNWAFYSEAIIQQFIRGGQSPEDINIMRVYCERSLQDILQWFVLATQNEKIEIILRPRPSTTIDEFQTVVKSILPEIPAHLHIIQQESIREWILASDVILSSHSTSLIEGAVAGKSVFILGPHPIPPSLKVKWHALLEHLNTCDDFLRVCAGDIEAEDTRLKDWAHKTMMRQGDSIRNIADFVAELLSGRMDVPPHPAREVATPSLKWIPPAWLWSIYRSIKQKVHFSATDGIEPQFVKDAISPEEINNRVQKWSHLFTVSE